MEEQILIQNIPEISAIYFALLQCGYDYYAFEKDADLVQAIEGFRATPMDYDVSFFEWMKRVPVSFPAFCYPCTQLAYSSGLSPGSWKA